MTSKPTKKIEIIRMERGLTLSGTRITLYDVMEQLKAQYPPSFIRDTFNLTDEQIKVALAYIETYKTEVEAEYQDVLRRAEETRKYWEDYNRERFARIAQTPPRPGYESVRVKLLERKMQRQATQK